MCIAQSTMELEFIILNKAIEEAEWLCQFLEDILRRSKPGCALTIHCDSQFMIGRAHNNMSNSKSKHIHSRHKTIRQLLASGVVVVDYVRSSDSIMDPLIQRVS